MIIDQENEKQPILNQRPRKDSSSSPASSESYHAEFSADMEPLQFSFGMSQGLRGMLDDSKGNEDMTTEGMSQVRHQLRGLNVGGRRQLYNTDLMGIDCEQFENYLQTARYVRVLERNESIPHLKRLFLAQELHLGANGNLSPEKAISVSQFSKNGKLMATGSKDGSIYIWKVISSPVERWEIDCANENAQKTQVTSRRAHLAMSDAKMKPIDLARTVTSPGMNLFAPVFHPEPFVTFTEHSLDVLDLDWSKNEFLVTASMDKTVKLWHPGRTTSLKTLQHSDFVTSVKFHPTDDRFVVSGCLDHKCRFWSVLENKVLFEFDCQDLITSVEISPASGNYVIVGTFKGYIHVLSIDKLRYLYSFHIKDTHTQGMNYLRSMDQVSKRPHHGPRVSGLQCSITPEKEIILVVTSNDSRIRIFDLESKTLLRVLKGFQGEKIRQRAHLQVWKGLPYITTSSDDHWFYCWKLTSTDATLHRSHGLHHQHNTSRSGNAVGHHMTEIGRSANHHHVLNGGRKLMHLPMAGVKELKRHSTNIGNFTLKHIIPVPGYAMDDQVIRNNRYVTFHAHHYPGTTSLVAPDETIKTLALSNDLICELTLQYFKENPAAEDKAPGQSQEVNAIGPIFVSTDSMGTIRIFRLDMTPGVKRDVLDKVHRYKNSTFGSSSTSRTDSLDLKRNCHSFTSINHPKLIASQRRRRSFSTPSSQDISFIRKMRPISSIVPANSQHIDSAQESSRHTSISATMLQAKCEVCAGTDFVPITKNALGQRESGFYCKDCGTVVNNFR